MMTPTTTTGIHAKLTEVEFNDTRCTNDSRNSYNQRVKHFMRLTREYYTLSYRNYGNISGYESHDDPRQTNPPLFHDGSVGIRALLISGQTWGVTSGMTAEKAQDMLLEDWRRQAEKSDKASNATALAHPCQGAHPSPSNNCKARLQEKGRMKKALREAPILRFTSNHC